MNRREILKAGSLAIAAGALGAASSWAQETPKPKSGDFKLKYAPGWGEFGKLAGGDPLSRLTFMREQGFRAMFHNGLPGESPEMQEKIGAKMKELGMTLGPYVLYADFSVKTFVLKDDEVRKMLLEKMKQSVEIMKRCGAQYALVVPGRYDESLEWEYQTANVIDNLRYCCDAVEEAGVTLVLEPLNRWNHPGLFLTKIPQAFEVCRAVNRKSCKIVNDLYHQQITEGNLIPNIDHAWSEIATFHLGDNPGRQEPGTGEINFKSIFKHLYEKKYDGALCMEHGKSKKDKEGEQALIDAYRAADSFEV